VITKLIDHCNVKRSDTSIDPKFDTTFGLSLYSLRIFREIIKNNMNRSIHGRITLRTIVECFITLKYLNTNHNHELWSAYRAYGIGQTKLALLKFDEIGEIPSFIDLNRLRYNMTFDRAEEFIPINLGNWEKTSLREMSEKSKTKKEYDTYYTITSGFVHGMWEAVDEASYEYCRNPLHRFHRIPLTETPQFNDISQDAIILINKILEEVDKIYPEFSHRL
jgi:hypothetical protein